MELLFCLLGLLIVVGALMGIAAMVRAAALQRRLQDLEREVKALQRQREHEPHDDDARSRDRGATPTPAAGPAHGLVSTAFGIAPPPPPPPPPEPEPPRVDPEPIAPPPPIEPRPTAPTPPAELLESAPTPPPRASEPAPPAPSPAQTPTAAFEGVEKTFGLRWLTWVGVAMLFLGVAFFLKYAWDRDWLGQLFGPRTRIATAATAALVLAFCGWRSLGKGMTALGQGLLSGGHALLYLTVYAAFQPAVMVVETPLLSTTAAFTTMALVTVVGLVLAVRANAIAMAFLAVLGGFATPVLVSSGQDARDALCAYLLLLDLGVLFVAARRSWRALDLLAFVGTVVLFGGWAWKWIDAHPQPDATLAWLATFHVVFLVLPFVHHWRRGTAVPVERFALALANVAWAFGCAAWLLRERAPALLAAGCLASAALHLVVGLVTASRAGGDARTRDGFTTIAILLLTLGLFWSVPANTTTAAWFAEAAALLWLGYRFANERTRVGALAVLTVAMARTLFVHLPASDRAAPFLWHPWCLTLLAASLGLAAFAWIHRRRAIATAERELAVAIGSVAGLWTLFAGAAEIVRHAEGHAEPWARIAPALAIAWWLLGGALAFFGWSLRSNGRTVFVVGFVPTLAAAISIGIAYDRYPADAWPALNGTCLGGLAVCAVLALAGRWSRRFFDDALAKSTAGLAQLAVTALATIETAAWLQRGGADPSAATLARGLGWVWLGCAIGGLVVGAATSNRRSITIALLPLVLAIGSGFGQFGVTLAPHRLVANQRFLFVTITSVVLASVRPLLRRLVPATTPPNADHFAALALTLQLLWAGCESVAWSRQGDHDGTALQWSTWLLGATAVAGAVLGRWRARVTGNGSLRTVAATALVASSCLPLFVYATRMGADWMFVNQRAALVAALLLWSRDHTNARSLRWAAFAVAWLGLTLEPPTWFLDHGDEPAEAARRALFSVTVTWLVVAVVTLVAGFRRDSRTARLVALALFALTAAKLLALDMSGAQQLYRILAFVLVGIVFVGASWLYHRVERRYAAGGR